MRVFRTWDQSRMHPKVRSDTETSAADATDTIEKANASTTCRLVLIRLFSQGSRAPDAIYRTVHRFP
jgi:hypothetical protein